MTAKAYNNRCITEWLAFELLAACGNPRYQDERLTAMSICVFLDLFGSLLCSHAFQTFTASMAKCPVTSVFSDMRKHALRACALC